MKSAFEIRPVTADDLPVLVMAESMGTDLTPLAGGQRYMGWGHTEKYGFAPMAVLDVNETEYVIEPHITWLPWVSAREICAAFKWFIETRRKVVFLIILKQHHKFYEHWVKRGLLKKVGVLPVPAEAGEEIHMYHKKDAP